MMFSAVAGVGIQFYFANISSQKAEIVKLKAEYESKKSIDERDQAIRDRADADRQLTQIKKELDCGCNAGSAVVIMK
jgi:uncharacterized protein YPO0396